MAARMFKLRKGEGNLSKKERAIIDARFKYDTPWSTQEIDRLVAICREEGSYRSVLVKQFPGKSYASIRY